MTCLNRTANSGVRTMLTPQPCSCGQPSTSQLMKHVVYVPVSGVTSSSCMHPRTPTHKYKYLMKHEVKGRVCRTVSKHLAMGWTAGVQLLSGVWVFLSTTTSRPALGTNRYLLSVTQEKSFDLRSAGGHCGGIYGPCQKHKALTLLNFSLCSSV
jgi:hypothetical protein